MAKATQPKPAPTGATELCGKTLLVHERLCREYGCPIGLIPANTSEARAHAPLAAQLPPDWEAHQVYDNHEALMLHGRRGCYFRSPECRRCAALDLCPHGQARLGLGGAAGDEVKP